MSEPVYGRLTPYELEKLGRGQYVEHGGRRVRITELVPRMDGGANYQAVEVELQEQPLSLGRDARPPIVLDEGHDEPVFGPDGTVNQAALDERLRAADEIAEQYGGARAREAEWEPPEFSPIKPVLAVWAKSNGWAGRGAIPKAVRARYAEQFGEG